jgi:predicted RNA-binding protein YlqC (UPF0109 family)
MLSQTSKNLSFSLISFILFFYKIREQEDRTGSGDLAPVGRGRGKVVGKKGRRMNTLQIMYTHVHKWKKILVDTVPGIKAGVKKISRGGEFKYDLFGTL